MADDTVQTGTDTIATDHVTTLNGAAVTQSATSPKVQRVKVTFGDDNTARDASAAFPLPTVTPNTYTTGTITAANANITSGTATANSSVQITVPDGHSSWDIFVSGTFSAGTVLYTQGSLDGTNWWSLNGRRNTDASTNDTTNFVASDFPGGASPAGSNPSNWRGSLGGVRFFRVTAFSYTAADSIAVQIATSAGVGAVFLNNFPNFKLSDGTTGTTTATVKAASTAIAAADQPLAVGLHPSSPLPAGSNVIGQVKPYAATAGAPVSNTVGVAASVVLTANATRTGVFMVNAGATTIYLNYNGTAPTTTLYSWRLDPGDRDRIDTATPIGQIQAISNGAGGTLLVTELT